MSDRCGDQGGSFQWNAWYRGWSHPVVFTAPNIEDAERQAAEYQQSNNVIMCRVAAQDPAAVVTARV